jgi:hypothetical protein
VTPPYTDPQTWVRFRANVVTIPGGCSLWVAPPRDDGYGQFWLAGPGRGVPVRAHRYAWTVWYGPIGPGVVVRHHCDEPLCVPLSRAAVDEHLAIGSQADNVADRDIRGRGARRRHGLAGWAVDRRGTAARSRAMHLALRDALAAGLQPDELRDVVARVRADGAVAAGQTALF